MNKELIKDFQLQAGGSHYPNINPDIQLAFAKLIVNECLSAVAATPTTAAYTTYDLGMVQTTIEMCAKSIKKRFEL